MFFRGFNASIVSPQWIYFQRTISRQNLETLKSSLEDNKIVLQEYNQSAAECTRKYLDLKQKYDLMSQSMKQIVEMQRSQTKLICDLDQNLSTENSNFQTLYQLSEVGIFEFCYLRRGEGCAKYGIC